MRSRFGRAATRVRASCATGSPQNGDAEQGLTERLAAGNLRARLGLPRGYGRRSGSDERRRVVIRDLLVLTLITFVPALELRASIPYGVFGLDGRMSWPMVALVCTLANTVLGAVVFLVMGPFFAALRRWRWFDARVWPRLERTRHKIHPYVEKYGEFGVAVFIGIPLPGSGVYTGAFGSYLLGLDRRRFMIANFLGVVIAAVAVTGLCLLISHGVVGEQSWLAKLFLKIRH